MLGLHEPVLDAAEAAKLGGAQDFLEQVTLLLVAVARSSIRGTDNARRRLILKRHPHLFARQMEYMAKAEALVCDAVAAHFARDPAWASGSAGFSPEETARMTVMLAAVPAKFRAKSNDFDPATGLTVQDLAPTVALFHHLQRKFS